MKLQLSDKDRKTLFIFLSLLVVACSFIFIYMPNNKKTAEINEETDQLKVQLQDYENKESMVPTLKADMAQYEEESGEILIKYPDNLTEEKVIRIIRDMEDDCETDVKKVGFTLPSQFYTATTPDAGNADPNAGNTDPNEAAVTKSLNGYLMEMSLDFKTTYEGIKKVIDYINDYPDCMSISAITLRYNSENGNLTGKMTLRMYYVPDGGKPYVEPDFGNIQSGVRNLFGAVTAKEDIVSPLPAGKDTEKANSKKDASKSDTKK